MFFNERKTLQCPIFFISNEVKTLQCNVSTVTQIYFCMSTHSQPLVSIVMAAYNAEKYIGEAIQSVLAQTHPHWELLITDDGSTDGTADIIKTFLNDSRIHYFFQPNAGVSAARNRAFRQMQGDFFLIFDADDVLTPNSLELRLRLFETNPNLYFVDGQVIRTTDTKNVAGCEVRTPNFKGNPQAALMCLDMRCFSVPCWLIRRLPSQTYEMEVGMTHCEDILFYIALSENPAYLYDSVPQVILYYRLHAQMAMTKLDKLEQGYKDFYMLLKKRYAPKWSIIWYLKYKIIRIMFLSYLRKGEIGKALRTVWNVFL
jgi:teichuronic acid biosynthesis glycosyltransferase TuaG